MSVDIETLLRHRPFVRALARRLVRDEARADDVVQDTYVAALSNPPRHGGALRAWLATVVRKIAWTHRRAEERRTRRERAGPPPPAPPGPEEVVERAGWHQRLVNLVMGLAEPYRTTLLLRYFEELNSSEIAKRQGVPAATVRTRLRRGLEQLRERLDEESAGGREMWLGALVAIGWPGGVTPPVPAGPSRWPLLGAAAAVVAVGLVGLQALDRGGEEAKRSAPASRSASPPAAREPSRGTVSHAGRFPPQEIDGHALKITVLAGGRPAPGARVVVQHLDRHPWRDWTYDKWTMAGRARADAGGQVRLDAVPAGYVRVLAAQAGEGRGEGVAFLPQEFDQPVVVELPCEEPLAVEVLELGGGRPVAGARVEIPGVLPDVSVAPTDTRGRTVVRGMSGRYRVSVRADGYAPFGPREVSGAGRLTVRLEPLRRSVAWPILGGAPAPGTPLLVRRIHEATARAPGRVHAGRVVVDGLPAGEIPELLAIAPNGTFARLFAEAGQDEGAAVSFARPPALEVFLRDTRGRPVAGVEVRLFLEAALEPAGRTGRDGRVSLPVYARERVALEVRELPRAPFQTVRTYDPAGGDARLEVTLPAAREVALRVRRDGTPGLPVDFQLYVDRTRVEPAADEERRVLRFSVRPARDGESVPVSLFAPGYLAATVVVPTGPPVRAQVDIDLIPAGSLELHLSRAAARHPIRLELVSVEAPEPRRGPWRFRLHPGPDGVVRENMLPPGSFRVRERVSGTATAEFSVLPGRGEVVVWLDLTDTPPSAPRRPAPPPAARPAGEGNRARLPVVPAPPAPREGETAPRVRLERAGGQAITLEGSVGNGALSFAGFLPGRYAIWIDLAGFAPQRLPEVTLRDGDNDLGTLVSRRGSSLRIRVFGRDGEPLPDLIFSAQALDPPRYQRSLQTGGAGRATLPGLGAGPFQVTAWERYTGLRVWSARLDADGTNDLAVDVDLR